MMGRDLEYVVQETINGMKKVAANIGLAGWKEKSADPQDVIRIELQEPIPEACKKTPDFIDHGVLFYACMAQIIEFTGTFTISSPGYS
jgi:hypothetical protein